MSLKQPLPVSTFALLSLGVLTLPAAAVQAPAAPATIAGVHASVIVLDQKLDGKNADLTYVYVPKKSFIVIFGSDSKGQPAGEPLASMPVDAGDHRNVKVALNGTVQPGAKLWVSLFEDTKPSGTFDKKAEVAYWPEGGLPLANSFLIR